MERDDTQARLERARQLAQWLDTRFKVGGFSVGWDPIIGLIPGIGDTITSLLSSYILLEAGQAGVPFSVLLRMAWNVILENVIGAVPIAGDLFDFYWKANRRNVQLLERAIADPHTTSRRSSLLMVTLIGLFLLLCLCVVATPILLLVLILK